MEKEEEKYIIENLPQLLATTTCDVVLLSNLEQQGIITDHDRQLICARGTSRDQAHKLYGILFHRERAFEALMCALKNTGQTGAFGLLNKYFTDPSLRQFPGSITYDLNEPLGTGAMSSKVYRGTFSGRVVAVKVINKRFVSEENVLKEIKILTTCDWHENIVRYYTAQLRADDSILLALELCDTTLTQWVTGSNKEELTPEDLEKMEVNILRQAARGVAHLHSLKIVHRSIKPDNILINIRINNQPDERIRVKISDFGLCRKIRDGETCLSFHADSEGYNFNDGWDPPELIEKYSKEKINSDDMEMTTAMDVFSLGCVFYYVISGGHHPFGENGRLRDASIMNDTPNFNLEHLNTAHFGMMLLVRSMITYIPALRPSCDMVLSHPCFWDVDKANNFLLNAHRFTSFAWQTVPVQECVSKLESHKWLILPNDELQWVKLVCHHIREYTKSLEMNSLESVTSLLQTVVLTYQEYTKLPKNVRHALGKFQKHRMEYWLQRFPFFMDLVWMSFQSLCGEFEFTNCYGRKEFQFNLQNSGELLQEYLERNVFEVINSAEMPEPELAEPERDILGAKPEWIAAQIAEVVHEYTNKNNTIVMHQAHFRRRFKRTLTALEYDQFVSELISQNRCKLLMHLDSRGCLPLHCAARALELLPRTYDTLRDAGVDIKAVDKSGNSVLFHALMGNQGDSITNIEQLVNIGYDLFVKNGNGETTLHIAAKFGKLEAIKYLISQGVRVNEQCKEGLTALSRILASMSPSTGEIVKVLMKHGANPNISPAGKSNALMRAAKLHPSIYSLHIIQDLIHGGASMDPTPADGMSFVAIVAEKQKPSVFHELIDYLYRTENADILNHTNIHYGTDLHVALAKFDVEQEILKIYADAGLDFNQRDSFGRSVFCIAIKHGRNRNCLEDLVRLQSNIDMESGDNENRTPLHWAVAKGNGVAVKFLYDMGCSFDVQSIDGLIEILSNGDGQVVNTVRNQIREILSEFNNTQPNICT